MHHYLNLEPRRGNSSFEYNFFHPNIDSFTLTFVSFPLLSGTIEFVCLRINDQSRRHQKALRFYYYGLVTDVVSHSENVPLKMQHDISRSTNNTKYGSWRDTGTLLLKIIYIELVISRLLSHKRYSVQIFRNKKISVFSYRLFERSILNKMQPWMKG